MGPFTYDARKFLAILDPLPPFLPLVSNRQQLITPPPNDVSMTLDPLK